MRRSVIGFLCLLALVGNGCAGKYADVKKANADFVKITESYVADLEKAGDAKAVAKAMNKFADEMGKMWPKMQKLSEKYPELKDRDNPPEELKESQKAAEEVGKKMGATFMKIMPYMKDPEVVKAQKRLSEAMTAQ